VGVATLLRGEPTRRSDPELLLDTVMGCVTTVVARQQLRDCPPSETEGKPSNLEPLAKAILRGARQMVRELAMSDATFAEIKQELSNEHMTDLVLTIAFYCAVVRVLATMKIDNEPTYKEVLKQYPIPGVN